MGTGTVFSSEQGRMCPECDRPVDACVCGGPTRGSGATDGVVRVSRVTKGKKGKCVTVIAGLALDDSDLKTLIKTLKTKCGSGGTVKDGALEIQGDHRRAIVDTLAAMGHRVKLAGG